MANNKMIICKSCGHEISSNAKTCPNCGAKNSKPIYQRPWFIILAIIALLIIIIPGGSNNGSKKVGETNNNDSNNNETKTEVKTQYSVGDILKDGDVEIVYIASGDYKNNNQFSEPKKGNKYIFLKFAFINNGKSDAGVSFYSFNAYADGYASEMYYGGEEDLSATLSAGRQTEGTIYFEVPIDAKDIEIEYSTNFFTSDKINFLFEGDKDSGYKLQPNTTRSENAYSVGDIIENDKVRISYLGVEPYTSTNMFISPKAGYHYESIKLEFENIGSSDRSVSYFSFNGYADGTALNQLYSRDDILSGTISAGRKAAGTITFEVPDDAEVIEYEYSDNIWTSSKIVFKVK